MKSRSRGVTKAEWLQAGLDTLAEGSLDDVTIEGLARKLGISKAGFYWHFKNRQDLLQNLLSYWIHETTEIAVDNPELQKMPPKKRLQTAAELIVDYNLAGFDMAFRQWARKDNLAAKAVRKVSRMRFNFILQAFHELGFRGNDADMRAMLYTAYHSSEAMFFTDISKKRRHELIKKRIDLLTSKTK